MGLEWQFLKAIPPPSIGRSGVWPFSGGVSHGIDAGDLGFKARGRGGSMPPERKNGFNPERRRSERSFKPCAPRRDRLRGRIAFVLGVRWYRRLNHRLHAGIPPGSEMGQTPALRSASESRAAVVFRVRRAGAIVYRWRRRLATSVNRPMRIRAIAASNVAISPLTKNQSRVVESRREPACFWRSA